MMAEVSSLYNASKTRQAANLPPAVPFSDLRAGHLRPSRGAPNRMQVERYWMEQYKGPVQRLDLPTDRPRPKQKTYRAERLDLNLDPQWWRTEGPRPPAHGASFVTTLLTTFELLLHKADRRHRTLVVGLPAAGQSDLGMKHLVGHCVNLLALRSGSTRRCSFDTNT
jgi:hypothetical protein